MSDSLVDLPRARQSLDGLSVGDAFGQRMFALPWIGQRRPALPPGPWSWTDDTHMALSVFEMLDCFGGIDQDALALAFVRRFAAEPLRGYAGGAVTVMKQIAAGTPWRAAASSLFGGRGSYGNGAAMRAAPIGAGFWRDPARATHEARLSAAVTHAHREGQAGAMAVAAAAAIAADPARPVGRDFLQAVLPLVGDSLTRERIALSVDLPGDGLDEAIEQLGTGADVSAQDTVPFCLWSAAYHLHDFEEAMWWTLIGDGDCDTTCAIVGGIVSTVVGVPLEWLSRREPLSG